MPPTSESQPEGGEANQSREQQRQEKVVGAAERCQLQKRIRQTHGRTLSLQDTVWKHAEIGEESCKVE